ncbi:glutathione S-transferase family protein [Hydrogenophaga sp. 5NK40-0174]|uniref:glutathione S-transferase family protein n=1 Tax=Hydrogenophaga sp. 5NK40-0174 TaxID=3127649 RepID=UPI0031029DF4
MALTLYIGNKNYSTWSMRPWVLLKQAGIEFQEVMLRFDSFQPGSDFKQSIQKISALGKVPVLTDGDLVIWDTLAIAEYLAEQFPEKSLWPADKAARARARSLCAEMHSGFSGLRSHCHMNIEADLSQVGRVIWRDQAAVRSEVQRLHTIWGDALKAHGGPMLFGEFSVADAFFAPVVSRLVTYALPVEPEIRAYMDRVMALPGVQAWVRDALKEHDFVAEDEPYRASPD